MADQDEFERWHADRGSPHTSFCAVSCRDSFTGGWITRGIVDGEQERENQSGGGDRA